VITDGDQANKDAPSYIPLDMSAQSVKDRGVMVYAISSRPEAVTNMNDLRSIASGNKYVYAYNIQRLPIVAPFIVDSWKNNMRGKNGCPLLC